ncbi:MAG: FAD-dependent oxidoreductase [Candidatus Omnitrophota bacterium]
MPTLKTKITVIGGGLLGLSIAYFLDKSGYTDITVVEKENNLGGACSWIKVDETIVSRFYHILLLEDSCIFNLMDELGIKNSYGFNVTRMGVFDGQKSYSISTLKELLTYPNLSIIDKFRLMYTLFYAKCQKDWKAIESTSVKEWLISIGGESNYRLLWQPIMRSKFGNTIKSLTAVDMWSRMNRLSSSRRTNFSQKMGYIKGTPKTLIDALENYLKKSGVKIIKGNAVQKVIADKNNTIDRIELEDGNIKSENYIFTISNLDFSELIEGNYLDYKNKLKQIIYLDNLSFILKLTKPLTPFYMLNLQDSSMPFTGVIGLTNVYPKVDFNDYSIFYISKYIFDGDTFFYKTKEEIFSLYLPYLKKINKEFNESWIAGFELSRGKRIETFRSIGYSKLIPERKTIFNNGFLVNTSQFYPRSTVLNTSVSVAKEFVNSVKKHNHLI